MVNENIESSSTGLQVPTTSTKNEQSRHHLTYADSCELYDDEILEKFQEVSIKANDYSRLAKRYPEIVRNYKTYYTNTANYYKMQVDHLKEELAAERCTNETRRQNIVRQSQILNKIVKQLNERYLIKKKQQQLARN